MELAELPELLELLLPPLSPPAVLLIARTMATTAKASASTATTMLPLLLSQLRRVETVGDAEDLAGIASQSTSLGMNVAPDLWRLLDEWFWWYVGLAYSVSRCSSKKYGWEGKKERKNEIWLGDPDKD